MKNVCYLHHNGFLIWHSVYVMLKIVSIDGNWFIGISH
jgi:hypothetical protein